MMHSGKGARKRAKIEEAAFEEWQFPRIEFPLWDELDECRAPRRALDPQVRPS
jgi:hypothetical protein